MNGVEYRLIECADLSAHEPKPQPQEVAKATEQVVVKIAQPESSVERPTVITKEFAASGAILLTTTAMHAIANRLMLNGSDQDEERRIAPFFTNMAIAPFSNKILRGNWREVDSHAKQLVVLTAHTASALTFDAALFLIPGGKQASFFGKASSIALSNCFGLLASMPVFTVLGKSSYSVNAPKIDEQTLKASWTTRRRATYALVATSAMVTSLVNRQMEPDSALSIVFSTTSTELSSKLFRQGSKAEDETTQKIRVIVFYTLFSVLGDAAVGLVLPGVAAYPLTHPFRYIGPTGATAILSMLKQLAKVKVEESDKEEKKNRKADNKQNEAPESCLTKKSWSYLIKKKALSLSAIAAPILAAVATCVNTYAGGSPTVSLGIKLVQHTLCFTAMRTLFKKSVNSSQQITLALSPLLIGVGVELASKAIFPFIPGLPVTAVALGITANLLGLLVSNKLLKVKDNDDE
jgi:hypothetical protein